MALTVVPQTDTEDDFFIVEDIDLSDESELRRIVAEVEALVGTPGRGLRISVLTAEQWQTVINRWLPPARRRGAAYHTHALRDPRDSMHLVVSPSGVRGVNERSPSMYEEIIYWLLRCLPTPIPKGPLLAGVNDVVAELCGDQVGMPLFAKHAPREAALIKAFIAVLVAEFQHRPSDWALLLRRSPDKFFLALRKTKFCSWWLAYIKRDEALAALMDEQSNKRAALIDMLRADDFSVASSFGLLTEQALGTYLDHLEDNNQS